MSSVKESPKESYKSQKKISKGNVEAKILHVCVFFFTKFIYFLMKDNCFTEFCCFLSNLNMNQP